MSRRMGKQVKAAVKRGLPQPLVRRIQEMRFKRRNRPKPIDGAALRLITEASLEDLRDAAWLEHELLPRLGLNDEEIHEFPRELHPYCGKGLRHWQYPNQFSKYLVNLADMSISSYMEIGVRHGGTFLITIEYLSRFNDLRDAIAVDIRDSRFLRERLADRSYARFRAANTQHADFASFVERQAPLDLVLVDGDHSEQGCQNDLDIVKPHTRTVVLHDIVSSACPGVAAVWNRFRRQEEDAWRFVEFTEQYDDVLQRQGAAYLGIGVATRH
jgi:cephalosporin hydroxylase